VRLQGMRGGSVSHEPIADRCPPSPGIAIAPQTERR